MFRLLLNVHVDSIVFDCGGMYLSVLLMSKRVFEI